MKKLFLGMFFTSILLVTFSIAFAADPWIVEEIRTGKLRPVPVSTSAGLAAALASSLPGDHIMLDPAGSFSGLFNVSRAGTENNPIVITTEDHAIVQGAFKITGAHNYVFAIEITGGPVGGGGAVDLLCNHCGAINNVIHERSGDIGIGAWNNGSNQVIYGNIIWRQIPNNNNPHNIYTQNDFSINGPKYFVANVSMDSSLATANTFNFHAYTEGGFISGMHVKKCIFANGRWLIGGWNQPHYKEIVEESLFYNSGIQFGFKRPIQYQFLNNYCGRSGLSDQWHWGAGEVQFGQLLTDPSIVSGNSFIFPPGKHWDLRTSAYTTAGRQEGIPKLRSVDTSNNNRFVSPDGKFHGSLYTGGTLQAAVDGLATWRNWTLQFGGVQFDTNSTESSSEPNKQFFIANDYDPDLGWLAIYNWENLPTVTFFKPGSFTIHKIKDPFGAPIATGTDSAVIPMTGEFETFLVKTTIAPPPECPNTIEELKKIRKNLTERTISCQAKVKRCKQEIDALILKLEECEQ